MIPEKAALSKRPAKKASEMVSVARLVADDRLPPQAVVALAVEDESEVFTGARGRTVGGLFLAASCAALIYFGFVSLARREVVEGALLPEAGALTVASPRDGLVVKALSAEGGKVKAGDPLFLVSLDTELPAGPPLTDRLDQAQALKRRALDAQASSDALQNAATLEDIGVRRRALLAQRRTLDQQTAVDVQRESLARQRIDKLEPLAAQGYFSQAQLQQLKDNLLLLQAGRLSLQREIGETDRTLAQLGAEERAAAAKAKGAEAARAGASADVLQSSAQVDQQRVIVVRAVADGRLSSVAIKPGMPIKSGQNLATLLPTGSQLEAELLLPSRAVPFVSVGDRVQLRYDAFPYQQFGVGYGTVREISVYPVQTESKDKGPADALYRVRARLDSQAVKADGESWLLFPGMRLSATVSLERGSVLRRWMRRLTPSR